MADNIRNSNAETGDSRPGRPVFSDRDAWSLWVSVWLPFASMVPAAAGA